MKDIIEKIKLKKPLNRLDDGFVEGFVNDFFKVNTKIKNKYLQLIAHINGKGLLAAVLFKNPKTGGPESKFTSRVCELAMEKGLLLVHTSRESIKIAPPLTISDAALREGLAVFEESIDEVGKSHKF